MKQGPGGPGELLSKLSPSYTQPIQDASLSFMQPAVNGELDGWRLLPVPHRESQK